MKISKNCEKKETQDEIQIIFSCKMYDKIQRKAI